MKKRVFLVSLFLGLLSVVFNVGCEGPFGGDDDCGPYFHNLEQVKYSGNNFYFSHSSNFPTSSKRQIKNDTLLKNSNNYLLIDMFFNDSVVNVINLAERKSPSSIFINSALACTSGRIDREFLNNITELQFNTFRIVNGIKVNDSLLRSNFQFINYQGYALPTYDIDSIIINNISDSLSYHENQLYGIQASVKMNHLEVNTGIQFELTMILDDSSTMKTASKRVFVK